MLDSPHYDEGSSTVPPDDFVRRARVAALTPDERLSVIAANTDTLHLALGAGKGTEREDDYVEQCRTAIRVIDAAAKNKPMDWL